MELAEALRKRKMVRSFSGAPIEEELLADLLSATLRAPRAGNTDGWDAVVLKGPEQTAALWEATTTAQWRRRSRRWPALAGAAVAVCIFCDPDAYLARYSEADKRESGLGSIELGGGGEAAWPVPYWFVDAGFAVLTLMLKATDANLASCFLGNFRGEEDLKERLGVPASRRYVGAVLIGTAGPADPPSPSLQRIRREAAQIFRSGSW